MLRENFSQLIIFITFLSLIIWTITDQLGRGQLKLKSREDWLLDGIGLSFQGIFIPLLQMTLIYWFYQHLIPNYQGCLKLSLICSFLISFVLVDYLYYWNHRLLHSNLFWPVHKVHHTVTQFDVLGTSRNTLWTSLLIIYLWIHPLFLHLLAHPIGYLFGISLTSSLDLWRHSRVNITPHSRFGKFLSPWLILPQDHAWHHCSEICHYNYGANLKIWDKLHGTYYQSQEFPAIRETKTSLNLMQKLLFPFL